MEKSTASQEVAAIGRLDAVPVMLDALCEISGLRFALVVHVNGTAWTVCAVRDGLHLEIPVGAPLSLRTNLNLESQTSQMPVVIEQASSDPNYRDPGRGVYQIESYVSVPIFLPGGSYFGNLCAFDPVPSKVAQPLILSMFNRFAAIIASQLAQQLQGERERSALLDERAAGELREQFIAILGHDLRNPLQAVYAGSDLLQRRLTDPALTQIAARIKTNVRRMSLLIDDVLDFARARLGGGIEVELTEVQNINAGLLTVIQEYEDAQPDCRIVASIAVNQPVRCDLGKLQQVTSNLLANALTHGRPNTPVEFSAVADATDLVLEVWNAGEPIPAQSIGKIFEPFWRHSVSASRQGLGLGLHICSQIVRAHGGRMTVTSTREDGTRFTARLPLLLPAERGPSSEERLPPDTPKMFQSHP